MSTSGTRDKGVGHGVRRAFRIRLPTIRFNKSGRFDYIRLALSARWTLIGREITVKGQQTAWVMLDRVARGGTNNAQECWGPWSNLGMAESAHYPRHYRLSTPALAPGSLCTRWKSPIFCAGHYLHVS